MINSVFNYCQLIIWGCDLAINKAYLILRLPTLRTIASILMEKLLSLFSFNLIYMEWRCMCVELFFNLDVEGYDCSSYLKIMAF